MCVCMNNISLCVCGQKRIVCVLNLYLLTASPYGWLTLENIWLWWLAGAWSYPGMLPGQVYQQSQIWADGIRQKLRRRTEKNGRWQGMKINTEASYNSVQYALSTVSLAPPVNKGFFESNPPPPPPPPPHYVTKFTSRIWYCWKDTPSPLLS